VSAPDFAHKNLALSWAQVHADTRTLAERLRTLGPWRGIVTIPRGGLVPAALLARALEVRVVETLCIASYDDRQQSEPVVLKPALLGGDERTGGEGWLLVDDLVDTGQTARVARAMLPKAHFATLYAKPVGRPLVETFVTEFPQETWIVFPWEA
jgi:xanthine phosphoribosyltransferase